MICNMKLFLSKKIPFFCFKFKKTHLLVSDVTLQERRYLSLLIFCACCQKVYSLQGFLSPQICGISSSNINGINGNSFQYKIQ